MSNYDTINAITVNLRTVLAGLGLQVEEGGFSADPTFTTSPGCRVRYPFEEFHDTFRQRPSACEARFEIEIYVNDADPQTRKQKQQQWVHAVRDAVTVDALNTGGLAASKLVSAVRSEEPEISYSWPLSTIRYRLNIRYREG